MLVEVRSRNQSPARKSQFYRLSQDSKNKEPKLGQAREYGDPNFVCFKIGKKEFFTHQHLFAEHSAYFRKMQANLQMRHAAEEFKEEAEINQPQIVIRLHKQTLPSILIIVLQYIENKFFFDASMDFETSFKIVQIADQLRMRKLESLLLCETIMQGVHKHNVIQLLNITHDKVLAKKSMYRNEEVKVPASSDSDDSERERRDKSRKRKREKFVFRRRN